MHFLQEQPDFEAADRIALTIRALCHYAISAMSVMNPESPEQTEMVFATADLTAVVHALAQQQEIGMDPTDISPKRVGRVLGKMRLKEQPRPGGKGKRQWRLTKGELRRRLMSSNLPLPSELFGEPASPQSPQALMALMAHSQHSLPAS